MIHVTKDLNQIFPKVLLRNPVLFRDIVINSVLPTVACPKLRRDLLNIMEKIVDSDYKRRHATHTKINKIDPGNTHW